MGTTLQLMLETEHVNTKLSTKYQHFVHVEVTGDVRNISRVWTKDGADWHRLLYVTC